MLATACPDSILTPQGVRMSLYQYPARLGKYRTNEQLCNLHRMKHSNLFGTTSAPSSILSVNIGIGRIITGVVNCSIHANWCATRSSLHWQLSICNYIYLGQRQELDKKKLQISRVTHLCRFLQENLTNFGLCSLQPSDNFSPVACLLHSAGNKCSLTVY